MMLTENTDFLKNYILVLFNSNMEKMCSGCHFIVIETSFNCKRFKITNSAHHSIAFYDKHLLHFILLNTITW